MDATVCIKAQIETNVGPDVSFNDQGECMDSDDLNDRILTSNTAPRNPCMLSVRFSTTKATDWSFS